MYYSRDREIWAYFLRTNSVFPYKTIPQIWINSLYSLRYHQHSVATICARCAMIVSNDITICTKSVLTKWVDAWVTNSSDFGNHFHEIMIYFRNLSKQSFQKYIKKLIKLQALIRNWDMSSWILFFLWYQIHQNCQHIQKFMPYLTGFSMYV